MLISQERCRARTVLTPLMRPKLLVLTRIGSPIRFHSGEQIGHFGFVETLLGALARVRGGVRSNTTWP